MASVLKVLCVHGVGQHPVGGAWETEWADAIRSACATVDSSRTIDIQYCHYDDIFDKHNVTLGDCLEALACLVVNGVTAPFRTARGSDSSLRYTAGLTVKWIESGTFRKETRERLSERISAFKPHVVLGHSLGSLVAYDTFTHSDTSSLCNGRMFVSLGSQIGNPFVRGQYQAGRLSALPQAKFWYHLYNLHDSVFTARIRLTADNYRQIETTFDIPGAADHSAAEYLRHPQTAETVWFDLLNGETSRISRSMRKEHRVAGRVATPTHRALLVGINDYPNPKDRLAGCANDTFLMSAMLQEVGIPAEDIRVVLDKRATADNIRSRIDWLLDNCRPGDQRVLYYSGHGAQLADYGLGDRIDRVDEALVPYDFDWSRDHAITDDWLFERYTQLPYDSAFTIILDCCHSGGMAKGGPLRIRGLNPPDDVRHRRLRWNQEHKMWVERDLDIQKTRAKTVDETDMPLAGMTGRLGYAMPVRTQRIQAMRERRKELGHKGPYMPVLLYACGEQQSAYEYEHGATSHGAFTFALVKNWRESRRTGGMTAQELVRLTSKELEGLRYDQKASLAGPPSQLKRPLIR
ncbi:caspase family protein [Lysobacter niastensis]|uniref:Caspase family protein n=1 Tax=Lysobacter niastensis TaxID=380629 RepID=A0ABS0B3Y0_9GAMM|nr:caspase family protein [Lysobacter niastensis]MBF6023214.1 caspase family protein [Lysobacter niastensis]